MIRDSCTEKETIQKRSLTFHLLQLSWRLSLISADDEQREKDGEQAATKEKWEKRK